MYRRRTINPRGVRKIDVQKERRESYKAAKKHAARLIELIHSNRLSGRLAEDEVLAHVLTIAYSYGWEQGFRDTQKCALDRLDEALAKGTLVKP